RRPAAGVDDAPGRQRAIHRHRAKPVRLRGDRGAGELPEEAPDGRAVSHSRVYSMAAMSVFERQTLPNGLRLLTAPMPHAQSVTCFVMLAAGSRYENRDTNGIAHFAEHMFFKGTERRPTARDLAAEVDSI